MRRMRSRVWKSGNSYQTSLPPSWVKKYGRRVEAKGDRYEVDKVELGDLIFFSAPFDVYHRRSTEFLVERWDEADIKMRIATAYLDGYDNIDISLQEGSQAPPNFEERITSYVPGTSLQTLQPRKYRLTFSDGYGVSLDDIVSSTAKQIFQELHRLVSNGFGRFPSKESEVKSLLEDSQIYERRFDGLTFYLKRQLNVSLSYPELCSRLGINNIHDIIHYDAFIASLERLSDLHTEILSQVYKASKNRFAPPSLEPLADFYAEAYSTIPESLAGMSDREKRMKIIRGKMNKWTNYGRLAKTSERATSFILNIRESNLVRDLVILEGKIQAIPDVASNACESLENMQRTPMVHPSVKVVAR